MAQPRRKSNALTFTARGRLTRVLTDVWISKAFDPEDPPSPLPRTHEVTALWDTGASKSAISPSVVTALDLVPVGSAKVHTAGGETSASTYVVNMILPNKVGFHGVLVTGLQGMEGFHAIIGMDIITQGDLAITNVGGRTCVSYRCPSVQTLDFVEEAEELDRAELKAKQKARQEAKAGAKRKPGPNSPCHCGSGRKYKKCCMRSDKRRST